LKIRREAKEMAKKIQFMRLEAEIPSSQQNSESEGSCNPSPDEASVAAVS